MDLSSSLSPLWKYHVFLSFRGKDTRRSFVSHLYKELDRMGIHVFKDNEKLERGKSLSHELLNAIEESRFSLVVISKNYASSTWCLDELVKIIECKTTFGQTVIPIFYEVDPSHARKQTGSFAEAFRRHEHNFKGDTLKVQRWREALTQVASLAGEDSRNWSEESKLVGKVVGDISDMLFSTPLNSFDDFVGMEAHVEMMATLLCSKCDEVRMVGIWGMGGIGKTTIARFFFDTLSNRYQFEGHCFIENVKENFRKHGPLHLQQELLASIFLERDLRIWSLVGSSNLIKQRLQNKKVLIVLDDVDQLEQLNVLAKSTNWFGRGSRIIITTRDKRLLVAHGVKQMYEVQFLKKDRALELFSHFAFKQSHPVRGFLDLSNEFVNYSGGLPLALKVLGSFLYHRSIPEWISTLSRLEKTPSNDIVQVLKYSYDGLDEQEKAIFLCVACFFNGQHVDHAIRLLDACGYSTKIGFEILAEKALMDISVSGQIKMHDLVQQMGRELVRQQSINQPGKRKMLWDTLEIYDILTDNAGTEEVEGIFLNMSEVKELSLSHTAFDRLPNLKFLKFYKYGDGESKVHLPAGLEYLPRKLRYLHWDAYPLKSLPSRFSPEYLVELKLKSSKLERLWEGIQPLANLKKMDLSLSKNLQEIPDLSEATNLEMLNLSWCQSLVELPSSIRGLNKLEHLHMSFCTKLESLPAGINLNVLEILDLSWCSSLRRFPEVSWNIKKLFLGQTRIEDVPLSIKHLSCIRTLNISECTSLKSLPSSISELKSLETLNLSGCSNLKSFPEPLEPMNGLWYLDLSRTSLKTLPASIIELASLTDLNLNYCKKLQSLPELPPSLLHLRAHGCISLEKISHCFRRFPDLLVLSNCSKVVQELPLLVHHMGRIQLFEISKIVCLPGIELPEWIKTHVGRHSLTIHLPKSSYTPKFEGIAACIVIAVKNKFHIRNFGIRCKWCFKSKHGDQNAGSIYWHIDLHDEYNDIESDHLFFLYNYNIFYCIDQRIMVTADKVSFSFEILNDLTGQRVPCKVKKCGVSLLPAQYEDEPTKITSNPGIISLTNRKAEDWILPMSPPSASSEPPWLPSVNLTHTASDRDSRSSLGGENMSRQAESDTALDEIIRRWFEGTGT